VRAIIAISFILLHLFANTELSELAKLPILVHHYFDHRHEHRHLSFTGFLKAHYTSLHKAKGKHNNQDQRQLPFKEHDPDFLTANISIVPRTYTYVQPFVYSETIKDALTNEIAVYSHFLADIWQPPRI
jgi:hypothetical protein